MTEFIERLANKSSIVRRKPIHGVGINDADYVTSMMVDGKKITCPYYLRWCSVMTRCYSKYLHKTHPTYADCSTCDEWVYFSRFKAWMIKQNWQGMHLDKDIISPENKIYSPDMCAFISPELNELLTDSRSARGEYPQGVYFYKPRKEFKAQINISGIRKHLGYYPTINDASCAYTKEKVRLIMLAAEDQDDERVAKGLRMHAEIYTKSHDDLMGF